MSLTRDPLLFVVTLTLVCIGGWCTSAAVGGIGQPFAGFLFLDNGVVADGSLPAWQPQDLSGAEILRADALSLAEHDRPGTALREYIASLGLGTPVRYEIRHGESIVSRTIPTRLFDVGDFVPVFGFLLVCGLSGAAMALGMRALRGRDPVANAIFVSLSLGAIWCLSSLDVYGPSGLFRVHAASECFLFAAAVHLALMVPTPVQWLRSRSRWIFVPYVFAFALAAVSQSGLYYPAVYRVTHQAAIWLFWLGLAALVAAQVVRFVRSASFEARQRVKLLGLGASLALGPAVVLVGWSSWTGGGEAESGLLLAAAAFPMAIGWAVLRRDLVEVDRLVRRSLGYAILGLGVVAVYAVGMMAVEGLRSDANFQRAAGAPFLFGVASVMLLMPLRTRLQRAVNLRFFELATTSVAPSSAPVSV